MRGRLSELLRSNSGRDSFLRLYTGTEVDQWALDELISVIPMLLQFPSGVSFIVAVHDRLRYRYARWTDGLFPLFPHILTGRPGYHLFWTIMATAPGNLVVPIARCVMDRFLVEIDPELTNLLCLIVRCFPDIMGEYQRILSLPMYLARPATAPVAVALLESGNPQSLGFFEAEIAGNLGGLLMAPDLIHVLGAYLSVTPRPQRTQAILQLAPRFEELVTHAWAWRVPWTIMSVATMPQRIGLLWVIVKVVCSMVVAPHLDELLGHALASVDVKTRLQALEKVQSAIFRNMVFPIVNDYLANLAQVLEDPDPP
jgi:hypothetical protein